MPSLKKTISAPEKAMLDFYYKVDTNAIELSTAHRLLTTGNPHNVTQADLGLESVPAAIESLQLEMPAHLGAYAHDDIAHANRGALDLVSGTNTGDQTMGTIGHPIPITYVDNSFTGITITLSETPNEYFHVFVFVDGLRMRLNTDYTRVGAVITAAGLLVGVKLVVDYWY